MIHAVLVMILSFLVVAAIFIEQTFATVLSGVLGLGALGVAMVFRKEAAGRLLEHWKVLGSLLLLLCLGGLSALWAEAGATPVLSRLGKLFGVGLIVTAFLVVPVSERIARAAMAGAALGIVLIAAFLIENTFVGYLRDFFVPAALSGDDAAYYANNVHKAPMTILALLVFPFLSWVLASRSDALLSKVALCGALLVCLALAVGDHLTVQTALAVGVLAALGGWAVPKVTAIGVVGVAAVWFFVLPPVLASSDLSTLLNVTKGNTSLQHRVLIADFAAQRIAERPVLGWGLDASRSVPTGGDRIRDTVERHDRFRIEDLHETVWRIAQNMPLHPHNFWLQVRLELGVAGGVAVLLLLGVMCRKLVSLADKRVRAAGFGALCVLLTVASVSYGAWQSWWLSFLALMVLFWRIAIQTPEGREAGLQGHS